MKNRRKKLWICFLLLFSQVFVMHFARALGSSIEENSRLMTLSNGISSPSLTSALLENPAGLVYNTSMKLMAFGGITGIGTGTLPAAGGLFVLGNGFVGAGIGFSNFNSQADTGGNLGLLNLGLGAGIPDIYTYLGITANYTLWNSTAGSWGQGTGNLIDANIGLLIGPNNGPVRFGVTLFDAITLFDVIGAGLSVDFTPWASLAVDAVMSVSSQSGATVTPSLGVNADPITLTLGYGIPLDSWAASWGRRGPQGGLGINFSNTVVFQLLYNHLTEYFASLLVAF